MKAHLLVNGFSHFSPHSKAKANYKSKNLRKISGISDVAFASVYSENPSDEFNYYYYEFIARNDGFWRAPEIEFRNETEARKLMVDFKFDALYR